MNKNILNIKNQDFIKNNLNTNIAALLLSGNEFSDVTMVELVGQIESRKKSQHKLPSWFNADGIYYPLKLSIEQTSSEITAQYKAERVDGNTLIDLTGGLGVDSYYFSKKIDRVVHCELNTELSEIAAHNFEVLGAQNAVCENVDGIAYLSENTSTYDWIYVDPSRRNDAKGKVFLLSDCLPDIPLHLDLLLSRSENIMMKTSPMLDINQGLKELKQVSEIHIVAVENEVKELLWIFKRGHTSNSPEIITVNLSQKRNQVFEFSKEEENGSLATYASPGSYLYEPNAAILKSGGFNILSEKLKLCKLHQHTHLYTSSEPVPFPGRSFHIDEIYPYNKKSLKKVFGNTKANITTRNFPESVAQIRKKLGIKDGGDTYLFFCTNYEGEKIVLSCTKFASEQ